MNKEGSARRGGMALAVVGLHLLLVVLAWQWKMGGSVAPARERLTTVRLLPLKPRSAAAAPAAAARMAPPPLPAMPPPTFVMVTPLPAVAAASQPAPSPAAAPTPDSNVTISLTGQASASSSTSTSGGPSGRGGRGKGAGSGPGGLSLEGSRAAMMGSLANPAVNDPRSNTPIPTFEEKIAMGLDPTICLLQERLPDGSIRRFWGHRREAQSTMGRTQGVATKPVGVCEP